MPCHNCSTHGEDNINTKRWSRVVAGNTDRLTQLISQKKKLPERLFAKPWQRRNKLDKFLIVFLRCGDQIARRTIDLVRNFCKVPQPVWVGKREILARAKVYDIEITTGLRRRYPEWLNAEQMGEVLESPRSTGTLGPAADIRRIYIYKPDRDYIWSLVRTVTHNDAHTLRDALWKYIDRETSIQVLISKFGLVTYRLEFSFSYLKLEIRSRDDGKSEGESGTDISQRKWPDLAFLKSDGDDTCWVLRECQVTFAISGSRNEGWTAFLFSNTGDEHEIFKEDDNNVELDSDEDDSDSEEGDNNERDEDDELAIETVNLMLDDHDAGLVPDFLAADGQEKDGEVEVQLLGDTEQDPRKYWLLISGLRLADGVAQWEDIVHYVDERVHAWEMKNIGTFSDWVDAKSQSEIRELNKWITDAIRLLNMFSDKIEATLMTWRNFNGEGGDSEYFHDINDLKHCEKFTRMRKSFERLKKLHSQLKPRIRSCEGLSAELSQHVNFEIHRLDLQSNRVNLESHTLQRETHNLNLQTCSMTRDMQILNRSSTDAAIATNHMAMLNSQFLWITSPILLVLQYFSFERDIFPLPRNAKTFVPYVIVSWIILQVLIKIISWMEPVKKVATKRIRKIICGLAQRNRTKDIERLQ